MKKYIPLVQQRYCCVPACIQMVLLRRNIPPISQEEIGYDLGLIVPQKDKKLFCKVRIGKKPLAGWGTQVEKENYSINRFFKKNKINLKSEYVFLTEPKRIKKFLKENLRNKDIIVLFNYGKLYRGKEGDSGHVSIIENITGNHIVLIDPEYDVPKRRIVTLEKMSKAIESHGKEKGGGFWVIS